MGKKSGPPAPPPPPDYTEDRQRAVETENTRRADIAKKYNTAIGSFNEQFGGFGGTLSEYEDTISGLSLGDDLSGLDTISDDLRKLDRDFEAFADGDVSFLEAYDPNKKVKENKERYQADLAAYEESTPTLSSGIETIKMKKLLPPPKQGARRWKQRASTLMTRLLPLLRKNKMICPYSTYPVLT